MLLLLGFTWMSITTLAAVYPSLTPSGKSRGKTFLFLFITLMVMRSKKDIWLLVWLLAFSVGFGIKGASLRLRLVGGTKV